jgi:hypothetical protein
MNKFSNVSMFILQLIASTTWQGNFRNSDWLLINKRLQSVSGGITVLSCTYYASRVGFPQFRKRTLPNFIKRGKEKNPGVNIRHHETFFCNPDSVKLIDAK